jgi:Luciferase-like monooxygenase
VRRREFITLLGGAAAAWPLAARTQQPAGMRRIGVLTAFAENDAEAQANITAFRQSLEKVGWIEGRNMPLTIAGAMPIPSAYGTMRSYDGVRRGAMPARIIGMIGVTPASDATLHVIEGGLSPRYLVEFARAHDEAGFDLALVGYSSSSAEGFLIALHAAANTKRLGYLIAHRPGFVAPTLMARKIATFDHLTGGRLAVHIITGKTDDEQQGDGDFSPKGERYLRAAEYLELMQLTWSSERPFDFSGHFYRVKGAASDICPLQKPHPLLFFGGASDDASSSRCSAARRRGHSGPARSSSRCRWSASSTAGPRLNGPISWPRSRKA